MHRAIACFCKPKMFVVHLQRGSKSMALALPRGSCAQWVGEIAGLQQLLQTRRPPRIKLDAYLVDHQ